MSQTQTQEEIKTQPKINIPKVKIVTNDKLNHGLLNDYTNSKGQRVDKPIKAEISGKALNESMSILKQIKDELSSRTIKRQPFMFSKDKENYMFMPRVLQGIASYKSEANKFNVK